MPDVSGDQLESFQKSLKSMTSDELRALTRNIRSSRKKPVAKAKAKPRAKSVKEVDIQTLVNNMSPAEIKALIEQMGGAPDGS